jgi:hypothetical protein
MNYGGVQQMNSRWNATVELEDGETISMVVRGKNVYKAILSVLEYKGVTRINKIMQRIVEKTFPEPPVNMVDIHYRPLKRNGKTFYA